ncbi:MAG: ABC transporter ATP-binding protein [Geminicoccaceae bacterium]
MRNIIHLFFRADGINPWAVLACLVAASVVEGLGFASLVPLLWIIAEPDNAEPSPVLELTRDIMATLGLSLDIGTLLVFFIATLVLRSVLTFVAMRHVGYAVAEFSTGLRSRIIEHLFRARWDYLVQHRVGRAASAISGESGRAGRAYYLAATFFAQAIQTIGYVVVAFVVSWPLALVAIAVGGLMALLLNSLVGTARKAGARQTQRTKELVVFLVDTLNNVKPLRAMGKEATFRNLLAERTESLKKSLRRQVISEEALKNGNEVLAAICLGVGFFLAISVWQVPIVELVVVGVLLKKTTSGIAKIQQSFQKAVMVESAYLEAHALGTEAAAAPEENPGQRAPTFERECRLAGVSFAHGAHEVLHAVSLSVPASGVTVLTGPSGAGKTTIADLILGLYQPDRGRILLDGVPLSELDLKRWRHLVGYVPQELALFHDTIFANVALGDRKIDKVDVQRALELAGAWTFVSGLPDGVMTVVGERGTKLSGGQRQRIALARALVSKPRLLILDEVTSALDPETEWQIVQGIRKLADAMAVLAITHRPAFLEVADRLYRVADGRVIEIAPDLPVAADA